MDVMKTLFLNPPSYDDFDGGAGSRYQATREVWSFWYPTWLAYPAGMLAHSRLLDASAQGFSLEEVIRRATSNPAKALAFPSGTGSLKEGAIADAAVFELREAPWEMVDSVQEKRAGKWRLKPVATVKAGRVYGNSVIPVYA